MKTASSGLKALLASSSELLMADLLDINLSTGATLHVTNALDDLVVGGTTYSSSQLGFSRGKTNLKTGLAVDTLDLTLFPLSGLTVGGIPFLQALRNGLLDGQAITLQRIYMPTWGDTSLGAVWLFGGESEVDEVTRTQVRLNVKSHLQRLDLALPRNLFQAQCSNTLYDTGCGVNAGSYTTSTIASSGSTALAIKTPLATADHYYDQGKLIATSGANTGAVAAIKSWAGGVATLFKPLLYAPAPGDGFQILPGCDRTQGSQGCAKYSNTARFRGEPFIPVPESTR